MKGKILADRALAASQRSIDSGKRFFDPAALTHRTTLGRQSGRLDLDAGAQLHDFKHFGDRRQPVKG